MTEFNTNLGLNLPEAPQSSGQNLGTVPVPVPVPVSVPVPVPVSVPVSVPSQDLIPIPTSNSDLNSDLNSETNIINSDYISRWSTNISNWLNKVDTNIKKIYLILNTYNTNKKITFSDSEENIYKYIKDINLNIDSIDSWINKTLKSYDKIIIDINNIQKSLIKNNETLYIYEYTEIIKRSIIFFNMLLPIIKEITNVKAYIIKVTEIIILNQETTNTNKNKKRKLDNYENEYDDKSYELLDVEVKKFLDDKKYSKINVISTFNDIINYLQTNNLRQELTEKMQTRIERFLNFLNKLNDEDIICIKKLNGLDIVNTCLRFHIIIIKNKNEWIKAIEYNIEQKLFSATGIYEMLSMFGFSSQQCKKTDLSYQHLDKRVQILYNKNIWIYNEDTFLANIHRSWNSNVAGVNTIRINKIQNKLDNGIDLILKASEL